MTTTANTVATGVFSKSEVRIEGRDKVSGRMKYTADHHRPNELWAAFTVSPYAHAKILRIDTTAARAVEGVRAVLTAPDIGNVLQGRMLYDWPVLAVGTVRFPGDRVAAVAADTRAAAERAAALVEVEYEELPTLLDPREALLPGAPVLHPDRNAYFMDFSGPAEALAATGATAIHFERPQVAHPNIQGEHQIRKGADDLAPIFASAHRVFEFTYSTPRVVAGYIEPRSTVVWIDDDGTVHVISPHKQPFRLRSQIANTTGVPKERNLVEPTAIGGDFGGKGVTVDEIPCYFLAQATGRPVRHVETYADALRTGPHRHPVHITLKTAVDADGKFLAHESTMLYAGGAYGATKPTVHLLPANGYFYLPYQVPNVKVDISAVYTNMAPLAHIRTPVSIQLYFGWEQHIEIMAAALGIDPIEFRRRNCVREGDTLPSNEMPYDWNGEAVLDTLRRESKWGAPLPPGRGRGIAFGLSRSGGAFTSLKMRLSADGSLAIETGVPDQGVGLFTLIQRVASAALGIGLDRISVRRVSTNLAGNDMGVGAAWGAHVHGRATEEGALRLREEIAERTGCVMRDGAFVDRAGRAISTAEVARQACRDGAIEVTGSYERSYYSPLPSDFMFTALCVEVDVDRETGAFKIDDVLLIVDVATIINPIGHQGQLDGGFIYGLGSAITEEILADESGRITTLSLGEYKLPTIADIPPLRTVLVRAGRGQGPFGAKAAGEVSNIGVGAAVINAIANAVGVRLTHYPITAERIFDALALKGGTVAF